MSSNIRVQKICEYCGAEFTARTTVTRYCSDLCTGRAGKARARGIKIEKSNAELQSVKLGKTELLNKKEFLTINEACELLSVSRWTVWRAIRKNELPSGRIGKRVIIRRTDIDRLFLEEHPEEKAKVSSVEETGKSIGALDPENCYTVGEIMDKYGVSGKALKDIIKRNNIPTSRSGRYNYVLRTSIDKIFNP